MPLLGNNVVGRQTTFGYIRV